MYELLADITARFELDIGSWKPVPGGDINSAYRLETGKGAYFLKVNLVEGFPDLFSAEATGLEALSQFVKVPKVIGFGSTQKLQYLLMEWLEADEKPGHFESAGRDLAQLHRVEQPEFGFKANNYLGTLSQRNETRVSWAEFYAQKRILPIVGILRRKGVFSENDVLSAERFCSRLNELYPREHPALLHGDLWRGNLMLTGSGAVFIDPAPYCGHREMDLAMTRLFGGFDAGFERAYHEVYPLEKGFDERAAYSQLYPLLFHAYAFGGSYVESCRRILKPF